MITISRSQVGFAMWVKDGEGTHAVLMDGANGSQVWVEVSASDASVYARMNGEDRVAEISDCSVCEQLPTGSACLSHTCPDCSSVAVGAVNASGELTHNCPTL